MAFAFLVILHVQTLAVPLWQETSQTSHHGGGAKLIEENKKCSAVGAVQYILVS